MKKILYIFLAAFLLNLIWEHAHKGLYANYQGGNITEFILFRASLTDAAIILGIFFVCLWLPRKYHILSIIALGILVAVFNEQWALAAGRWGYNELMPIVPFLDTGLTPTVQLGVTGYIVYELVGKK